MKFIILTSYFVILFSLFFAVNKIKANKVHFPNYPSTRLSGEATGLSEVAFESLFLHKESSQKEQYYKSNSTQISSNARDILANKKINKSPKNRQAETNENNRKQEEDNFLSGFNIEVVKKEKPKAKKSFKNNKTKNLKEKINYKEYIETVNTTLSNSILEKIELLNKTLKSKKINKVDETEYFSRKGINTSEYINLLSHVISNSNSKLSLPFNTILGKIALLYGRNKVEQMDAEVERIRKMDIEQATDTIIKFSEDIKLKSDSENLYWYYFYIVSNVVLKGRLVLNKKVSPNIYSVKKWKMIKELSAKKKQLLKPGEDKNYDELFAKDFEYNSIIFHLRTITLFELKYSQGNVKGKDKIENKEKLEEFEKVFGVKAKKENKLENSKVKKSNFHSHPQLRQWMDKSLNIFQRSLRDFQPNIYLTSEIKKTFFYRKLKNFPKGVIHHLHWSAAFYMGDIMIGIKKLVERNLAQNMITVIINSDIYLEDKTRPESYFDIASPRLFIIEDFLTFLDKLHNDTAFEKDTLIFNDNFMLADGRCVLNPIVGDVKINPDLKAYLFFKNCKGSIMYTDYLDKIISLDSFMNFKNVKKLKDLLDFLEEHSHILDDNENLQKKFLPNSYKDVLYNVKDQLSVAVWFKFETIFGIYSELFENVNIFKTLTEILYTDLMHDNVAGVEFRQGYDLPEDNSKYNLNSDNQSKMQILEDLSKRNNIKMPVSFILPGRKLKKNHKLRNLIKNLSAAKSKGKDNVTGFDFFGYEDDPFSGARNFITLTLKNLMNINSLDEKENLDLDKNDFAFMLDALKKGDKLFLHAGETTYLPNYPVSKSFLKQFYINDNLIHSALLPNVERLGHGFAVINNELLMNIYKKKGISLEICPTSNQALHYFNVYQNPIQVLLKKGLSVTVSPDDPGLFFYSGVRMDWFNLMMHTSIDASDYYMLIRNSILKSSIPEIQRNKEKLLQSAKDEIVHFFDDIEASDELKLFKKNSSFFSSYLNISDYEKAFRIQIKSENKNTLLKNLLKNKSDKIKQNKYPYLNIYDIDEIMEIAIERDMKKEITRSSSASA